MVRNAMPQRLVVLRNIVAHNIAMNKLTYLLIGLILVLLILIGVTVYSKNAKQTSVVQPPVYTDFSVTLPSNTGPKVTVPNFLTDPSVIPDPQNKGLYNIEQASTSITAPENSENFAITYEKATGYFDVVLLKKPFSVARENAEHSLRNLLKLDNSSMCGLSYTVSIPRYVDSKAYGTDYRFSFCPGSVTLP